MKRTAIIAAIPGELKPLVQGWEHERRGNIFLWKRGTGDEEWIAGCGGAGQAAACRVFSSIEAYGPLDKVISTGWAGALQEGCTAGGAYDISGVIDARTGERFRVDTPIPECWLVTSPKIADETEKLRLYNTYGAALVDMEAAGVARMASMRKIPFYCVKGVSDGLRTRLPDLNRFLSSSGQLNLRGLVLFSLFRPRYWPALVEMGENSKKAAQEIARMLLDLLDERGHIRNQNGYPNLQH